MSEEKERIMRVPYKAEIHKGSTEFKAEDQTKTTFCCPEMKGAWEERAVHFGDYEHIYNRLNRVCIYHCSAYPEGACWDEYVINFCPFCGAKIVCEQVAAVQITYRKVRRTAEIEVREETPIERVKET
jgi:hypothetical protein